MIVVLLKMAWWGVLSFSAKKLNYWNDIKKLNPIAIHGFSRLKMFRDLNLLAILASL